MHVSGAPLVSFSCFQCEGCGAEPRIKATLLLEKGYGVPYHRVIGRSGHFFGFVVLQLILYEPHHAKMCLLRFLTSEDSNQPFVNCCQLMYLVISLLLLRAGYGI